MADNEDIDILNKNLNRYDDPDYLNVNGYRPSVDLNSKLKFEKSTIEKIASVAAYQVPGVLALKGGVISGIQETFGSEDMTKGVSAEIGEKEAAFDISIIMEHGYSAQKAYDDIKEIVSEHIQSMTGLVAVEINLKIVDLRTKRDYENYKNPDSDNLR